MLLVIGYGNVLRGDDAIGPLVAQALEDEITCADVEFLTCHQLAPELAEYLSRAEAALFIDASATAAPGVIEGREVVPAQAVPGSMTHHLTPGVLLTLAEVLFGSRPQAYLLTMGGASFECGAGLSPQVSAALPQLHEAARQIIRQFVDSFSPVAH